MTTTTHDPKRVTKDDAAIGNRLKFARLAAGKSQSEVGQALGITFQQVQKYEKGANRLPPSRLVKAAQFLGVSPATLLTGDENPEAAEAMLTLSENRTGIELVVLFNGLPKAQRATVMTLVRTLATGEDVAA